ncbi:MAG TPA: hypothetical protein VND93_08580 [Myxococcales bacterium]|jgi:hypothetical protein|nr:hypothetical protein [Myxococcales bacterium]
MLTANTKYALQRYAIIGAAILMAVGVLAGDGLRSRAASDGVGPAQADSARRTTSPAPLPQKS